MILVAVDDLLFSSKIRAVARQAGVELTFARTQAEVLEQARTVMPSLALFDLNSGRIDPIATIAANPIELAVVDVHLPDMAGSQLCRLIKRQNVGLLVLQTSATSAAPVDEGANGADAYLAEPIEPMEFVGAVRALLRLRDAESHRELLVRELSHRVKNTLAIVQSLVSFTRRSVVSLDEFEALLISRVHAMARAHDILMQTAGEGASPGLPLEDATTDPAETTVEGSGPSGEAEPFALSGNPT